MQALTSSAALNRRPLLLVAVHWLTLLLVITAVAAILLREEIEGRATRQLLMSIHRNLGLGIGLLMLLRLGLRVKFHPLPHNVEMALPARLAASAVHVLLYLMMLALPLLGWSLLNAHGQSVDLLGIPLPALCAEDEDLADRLGEYHEDAAWVFISLIGVHAAAALWHHFVLRDNVLRGMLPRCRRCS